MTRSVEFMQNKDLWIPLESREQYHFLGFHHDTTKLLYVEDYSKLSGCPLNPSPHFLWNDINLSKASSFKNHEFTLKTEDNDSKFILRRSHCAGVKVYAHLNCSCNIDIHNEHSFKVCAGVNGTPCSHTVANRNTVNNCLNHNLAALIPTGPCSDCFFIYISPVEETDRRRWMGFLSNSNPKATHHHLQPAYSKIDSFVKCAIRTLVKKDPTKTANDISKGTGLGFSTRIASPATANKTTLRNFVATTRIDINGASSRDIIKRFNELVKDKADEADEKNAVSSIFHQQVLDRCSPYVRYCMKLLNRISIYSDFDFILGIPNVANLLIWLF